MMSFVRHLTLRRNGLKRWSLNTQIHALEFGTIPSQAQVVVCGMGIVGNSIAYHLTENGWNDVVVLDQNSCILDRDCLAWNNLDENWDKTIEYHHTAKQKGKIGSGTSYYGSGVLGLFKPLSESRLISDSVNLIKRLQESGHDCGFRQCGSLNLARSHDRSTMLKRRMAFTVPAGLHCEWLDQNALKKLHPYLFTDDIIGGVWVPDDAVAEPFAVCAKLAALAQAQGATYIENCEVEYICTDKIAHSQIVPRVTEVVTSLGTIKCEYFVNASGMWSHHLGEKSSPKVIIPCFPANHYYLHTNLLAEAKDYLPVIRDYDAHTFVFTRNQQFVIGGFEPNAQPAFDYLIPKDWRDTLVADDEHFRPIKESAQHRLPLLQETHFQPLMNSPDNFTPDGKWILGETAEIDNYFVAVGMNGNGLQGSGGAGKSIAEWIINGSPAVEMLPYDVRRFVPLHNNRRYLRERMREAVARHYEIHYYSICEYQMARKLRCSPLYSEHEARGALFGTSMGHERPLYFDKNYRKGDPPVASPKGTFRKPPYFDSIREGHHACREAVGLVDFSSFTKIEITSFGLTGKKKFEAEEDKSAGEGREVVNYMQRLCSNDVDVPVGGVVHTGMQNERGGYENDCLLIRKSEHSFLMLAPTMQQTSVMDWMRRQITADTSVSISDVTSMYTVLTLVGPKSRDMLSLMSNTDLAFFGYRAKEVNIAYSSGVIALSFTHVGDPGYTLIIPSEYTLHIYSQLMKVGHDYGIRNIGMLTIRSLRVEKFIPFWAAELNSTTTPYEVGRGYKVKPNKEYFIGKSALVHQQKQGVKKHLVHFTLEDSFDPYTELWPWGGEPIYRNGSLVGNVTSTAFGFTLNRIVCLGFVSHHEEGEFVTAEYILGDAHYQVDIAGTRVTLCPSMQAPKMPAVKMDGVASYRPRVRGIVTQK